MSDTPRTDKVEKAGLKTHADDEEAGLAWGFARQLERELVAMETRLHQLCNVAEEMNAVITHLQKKLREAK